MFHCTFLSESLVEKQFHCWKKQDEGKMPSHYFLTQNVASMQAAAYRAPLCTSTAALECRIAALHWTVLLIPVAT